MDHYVPGTVGEYPAGPTEIIWSDFMRAGFEPRHVFRRTSSITLRAEQLNSQKQILRHIHSNRICLVCLLGVAQHVLSYGHALCDRCVQVFGTPTAGYDYRLRSELPLLLLPTTTYRRYYGPNNEPINIGYRRWGIRASGGFCALNLIRPFHNGPVIGQRISSMASWLLRDSCYDARVFDDVLKETFGEYRRMFGPSRDDPKGSSHTPAPRPAWLRQESPKTRARLSSLTFIRRDRNEAGPGPRPRPPLFYPADLQGIGSFQDGGLKHNFAGAIALEVSHQIWPNAGGDNPGFAHHAGGYSQEIRILARHEDHEINIFLETGSKKRWRASGFPATVASFVDKQGFHSRFGRDDHGKPGWASCKMCDVSRMQTKRKCAIVAPNAETLKRARRPERK
ncbi:hypothetical protein N7470_010083 [Penicillium chermesinum]|nr:hypothetical protein N7470_010083 [Penicillium chermesinum]